MSASIHISNLTRRNFNPTRRCNKTLPLSSMNFFLLSSHCGLFVRIMITVVTSLRNCLFSCHLFHPLTGWLPLTACSHSRSCGPKLSCKSTDHSQQPFAFMLLSLLELFHRFTPQIFYKWFLRPLFNHFNLISSS